MNKTIAVVTGANRGIGLEIVRALVESPPTAAAAAAPGVSGPYHVFLSCRDIEKGKEAIASLEPQHGNSVSALRLDVTSAESIAQAVSTVRAEAGRVDVLVNNAGIVSSAEDDVTRLRETLEMNTVAPFAVTAAFKPLLLAQGATAAAKGKCIVHVSSSLGSVTSKLDAGWKYHAVPWTEYRMSKAALNMLAACHASELGEHGGRAFAFDPGFAATSLTGTPEERRQRGAVEPRVSGLKCRDIIEGRHDDIAKSLISVDFDAMPW